MTVYLLKPGELTLKGGNRKVFEKILRRNLASLLKGSGAQLIMKEGRSFVHAPADSEAAVEDALGHLMGISGWAKT
jgi:thiamine biosynthesis protein ThiI